MVTDFPKLLNMMLMQAYHNILRIEEEFLQKNGRIDLTIREMHLIECVGEAGQEGNTASEIADFLRIARPSASVAIKKLVEKGYLNKNACGTDGRSVRVTLTREGRKVYLYHMRYHMNMVDEISLGLDEEERGVLVRAIQKLNGFFEKGAASAV